MAHHGTPFAFLYTLVLMPRPASEYVARAMPCNVGDMTVSSPRGLRLVPAAENSDANTGRLRSLLQHELSSVSMRGRSTT